MTHSFEKNQTVRFVREPIDIQFKQHFTLAKEYIQLGKLYEVEHVFAGEPAQLELKGIDPMLFSADMFIVVK